MKKFERFIIYPLLFIALFFSFADDGLQQTTAQQVYDELIAKNIKIVNDDGKTMIELKTEKPVEDDLWNLINYDSGRIIISGDYSQENYKDETLIGTNSILFREYNTESKDSFPSSSSFLSSNYFSLSSKNTSIKMKADKSDGSNITIKNNSARITDKNINNHKQYVNFIQIGRNNTYSEEGKTNLNSLYPSISFYYDEIKDNKDFYYPTFNNLKTEITSRIELKQNGNNKVFIGNIEESGLIDLRNNNNSRIIYLGSTGANNEGKYGGHGVIGIWDKYGEDYRSYSYEY